MGRLQHSVGTAGAGKPRDFAARHDPHQFPSLPFASILLGLGDESADARRGRKPARARHQALHRSDVLQARETRERSALAPGLRLLARGRAEAAELLDRD